MMNSCSENNSSNSEQNKSSENSTSDNSTSDNAIHFITVGTSGIILTSNDGLEWDQQNSGTEETLFGIKKYNNKYFAVGAKGVLLKSNDGKIWLSDNISTQSYLQDIIYKDNLYIVSGGTDGSGNNSVFFHSNDSINWNKISTDSYRDWNKIIYFNSENRFIAVAGGGGGVKSFIGNSTNGTSWAFTGTNYNSQPLSSIVSDNDSLVAVGSSGTIITSNDIFGWSSQNSGVSSNLTEIIIVDDKFWAVGRSPGIIINSDDKINWTKKYENSNEHFQSITYGNSKFIAVGQDGLIRSSVNGINWDNKSLSINNVLYSVIYVD